MAPKRPPQKPQDPKPSSAKPNPPTEEVDEAAEVGVPAQVLKPLQEMGVDVTNPIELERAVIGITARMSQSPWPSAEMLQDYRDFDPEIPYKLIAELQTQAEHRRSLDTKRLEGSEARQNRSQYFSFILSVLGILAAGGFSLAGAPTTLTVAMVIVAIGGPGTATVLARLVDKWTR